MDYFRKTVILKQVQEGFSQGGKSVSAIARLETESGVSTLSISTINLAPVSDGEYFAFILDDNGALLSCELGKTPISVTKVLNFSPHLKGEVAVGISFIKDNIPLLIAYANSENKPNMSLLKQRIIDKCIKEREIEESALQARALEKERQKKGDTPKILDKDEGKKNDKTPDTSPSDCYNDEVVATENYYLLDQEFDKKLKAVENLDYELLRNKNDLSSSGNKTQTAKADARSFIFENEKDSTSSQNYSKEYPYYKTVEKELDDIFNKFEKETSLENVLDKSKWVRIYYSEKKYYVVGIIYYKENPPDNSLKEKYLCYGVPAKYSLTPPKELDGFCSFIPLSVFDMTGDGYWIMFQDAITGECVKRPER